MDRLQPQKLKITLIGVSSAGSPPFPMKIYQMFFLKKFLAITEITIEQVKPILSPKNILYPETTEEEQIESAKITYGIE